MRQKSEKEVAFVYQNVSTVAKPATFWESSVCLECITNQLGPPAKPPIVQNGTYHSQKLLFNNKFLLPKPARADVQEMSTKFVS